MRKELEIAQEKKKQFEQSNDMLKQVIKSLGGDGSRGTSASGRFLIVHRQKTQFSKSYGNHKYQSTFLTCKWQQHAHAHCAAARGELRSEWYAAAPAA